MAYDGYRIQKFFLNIKGITHTEPADPLFEVNLAHAVSVNLTNNSTWIKQPFALGSVIFVPV